MPKIYHYRPAAPLLINLQTQPSQIMVKALVFKGDKKTKKRRRIADDSENQIAELGCNGTIVTTSAAGEEDDSWVTAEAVSDIAGPVIFCLPTSPPTCLASDANGKIFASDLENLTDADPATAEPHEVRQVWVANRVAGSERFSFKGHHGRYLGCNKFGILSATTEAVSPEESFLAIAAPDTPTMLAFQTVRDTFLTVEDRKTLGEPSLRGDADTITFNSTFRIRMQARFKPRLKASKEEKAREKISRKELEDAVGRRLEDTEVRGLKKARREGNYHEALLDVKVKGKHDKFA